LIKKIDPIKIAFLQFAVCSLLSFIVSFAIEVITLQNIYNALIPILYGGLISVGIAYTLQVVAQQYAPPSHAAIILSLESVFGLLGGWLILNETISLRGIIGCSLMLAGMILSQISISAGNKINDKSFAES
jgi:drug/metabolite transporter (DMT)-like permease